MNHYDYHTRLKALWEKGVEDYSNGGRVPGAYLTEEERAFLGEIGANEQDLYDFTDDSIRYGEPDFEMFWAVQSMCFNYFKMIMKNRPGDYIAPMAAYSPKDAEINGIPWLPRIIQKAKRKLRGELDPDIMYGCGGDRQFCKTHNLHLAEFLQLVWNHWDDHQAIAAYIEAHSPALQKQEV